MNRTSLSLICLFIASVCFALGVYWYRVELFDQPLLRGLTFALYMWIPGAVALIFARMEKVSLPILKKPTKDFFIAPLWGIAICALSFLLSIPFATALKPSPLFATYSTLKGIGLLSGLIAASYLAALTTNMVAALGEELYFRGYLLEKLKGWGIFKAIGITGGLWGLWNIPAIVLMGLNYPSKPIMGSVMMVLISLSLTPLLVYYRFKGKSLLVSASLHGAFNSVVGFSQFFFFDPNPLIVGITGVTGILAILVISAGLNLFSRKTWKKVLV